MFMSVLDKAFIAILVFSVFIILIVIIVGLRQKVRLSVRIPMFKVEYETDYYRRSKKDNDSRK